MARYKLVKGNQEPVFQSMDEFRELFPDDYVYDNWRDAPTESWTLTDDGQVCRIIKRLSMKSGGELVTTVLGTRHSERKHLMSGVPPKNIYSLSRNENSAVHRANKPNLTKRERLFAKYVASGMNPTDAYLKVYPTEKEVYAKNQATILLKTERVSKLVSEEIKKSMLKAGIDEDYLLETAKTIVDKESARDSDRLRALEMLMKIAGMFPKEKKTESLAVFEGFTKEKLAQLGGASVKLISHGEKDPA